MSPAIAGIGALPVTKNLELSMRDSAVAVALAALEDGGFSAKDVDAIFVTPPCLSGAPGFMWSCTLAHHLGLRTRAMALVEAGGMTASLAFKLAVDEVAHGRSRLALVVATDARVDDVPSGNLELYARNMVERLVGIYGPYDGVYGLAAPIPYYAMSAQRYMHEHGANEADLARVAVTLRKFAIENDLAQYREPITIDDVLASRVVCPPLRLLDCSPFASGAAALLVASDDVARAGKKRAVRVLAIGEHHEPAHFAPLRAPITSFESATRAAREAYSLAKKTPRDIDVAELYGVFTATELCLYEDLGFFEKGRAARAVRDGETSGWGRTVMNPSGGRLSVGHPAGVTPMLELHELVTQLRGEAGARQVRDARTGLMHAEHGMMNGSLVAILEAA